MKLATTIPVAKRAIVPLLFVNSTLRNFNLFCHLLHSITSRRHTGHFLLTFVTSRDTERYYPENQRLKCYSCTDSCSSSTPPSSFLGASSHSSSREDLNTVGNDPPARGALLTCFDASRLNENRLRPATITETNRIIIVAGVKLASGP